MDFKLVSEFEPAGDQPEAIDQLVDGLRRGVKHQTLLGVTGSGKTFTMANVIERTQPAHDRHFPQQDPCGAAVPGIQGLFPGKRGGIFRESSTITTSRKHIFLRPTRISRKPRKSTTRSTGFVSKRRHLLCQETTSSSSRACRASTTSAPPSPMPRRARKSTAAKTWTVTASSGSSRGCSTTGTT